jgi:hypothetical protein
MNVDSRRHIEPSSQRALSILFTWGWPVLYVPCDVDHSVVIPIRGRAESVPLAGTESVVRVHTARVYVTHPHTTNKTTTRPHT